MSSTPVTASGAPRRAGRRARRVVGACAGLLAALAVGAVPAQAAPADASLFGIDTFTTRSIGSTLAGGHPTVSTRIRFTTGEVGRGVTVPHGTPQRIEVDMPMGLVGDPSATPKCTRAQFRANRCPPQSQIGISEPWPAPFTGVLGTRPIYNLVPDADSPALFGIDVLGFINNVAYLRVFVRADGGLRTVTDPLPSATPLIENTLTFWGVPADMNVCNPNNPGFDPVAPSPYSFPPGPPCPRTDPASWERKPLMSAPTDCSLVPASTLRVYSYEGRFDTQTRFQEHEPDDCAGLEFDPTVDVAPTSRTAGAPTGLDVDINVPQRNHPDGRVTPRVDGVSVTLPEGMAISPAAADGLTSCSDAAFGKGQETAARCPEAAKIGSVQIDTPLLPKPLPGSIYIGEQKPGQIFRLFILAEGSGIRLKLAGVIRPDPVTGRLTTTFEDNPQLPFSRFHLEFKDGPRAPLVNPTSCGTHTTSTQVTAWSGHQVQSDSTFEITRDGRGAACPGQGFTPGFEAGTLDPVGGTSSAFTLTFSRDDDDQLLRAIDVTMPDGLTGRIADLAALCPDAAAAAGTCDEGSRIGSVRTGAGAGSSPLFLPGRVYMTGPYKGAPFGLSIVVPAIAGPFDLGTVVVRAAIHVDKRTASLRIVSDPLPTILEGVPLQVRTVTVTVDRRGFMLNPSSCSPKRVGAQISSVAGTLANVASRFQVGSCASLPFAPRMSLRVGARGRNKQRGSVPLAVTLTQGAGQAANKSVNVTLPLTLSSRLPVLSRACTLAEFDAGTCSDGAKVGSATAVTPVLRDPLTGPAYFVRNPNRRLPDLMVRLRGQVAIDLTGVVSIPGGRSLGTKFTAPDVPISKFTLRLVSGENGPLAVAAKDLCSASSRRATAKLGFRAHNGKLVQKRQRLSVAGCGKPAKKADR